MGSIGGSLRARGNRISLEGAIAGTAELRANRIVIAPGARITGEVVAHSPEPPQVAPDAVVTGGIRHIPAEAPLPDAGDIRRLSWQLSLAAAATFAAGLLVFVLLAQAIVPGLMWQSVQQIRSEPWGTLGRGIAWALLVPAVIVLLFASLIGIPAGFVLAGAFIALLGLSLVAAAFGLGLWLRDRRQPAGDPGTAWRRIGWTVVGLVLILIAALIPIIGWVAVLLAVLTGLGAVGTSAWRRLSGRVPEGAAPADGNGPGTARA